MQETAKKTSATVAAGHGRQGHGTNIIKAELLNQPEAIVEVGLISDFSEHLKADLGNTVAHRGRGARQNVDPLQRKNFVPLSPRSGARGAGKPNVDPSSFTAANGLAR